MRVDAYVDEFARGRPTRSWIGLYSSLLLLTLAGYAIFGKGFAYVGVPPLFIGEVVLGIGLLCIVATGCEFAVLASLPGVTLAIMMGWVLIRTVPFVENCGVDALRDSVIVMYGLFAYVVIALLLDRPERLGKTLLAYSRFAWVYGAIGGLLFYMSVSLPDILSWPGTQIRLPYVRAGEAAVHLAGATCFALLGLRPGRFGPFWVLLLLISIAMVTPSRGAMLTCMLPITLAVLAGGLLRTFLPVLAMAVALFAVAYGLGLELPTPGGRGAGPEQILANIESLVGTSHVSNLDGTKMWRLNWWNSISHYTLEGPYFWTGKGFGINLAQADGFVVGLEHGGTILRSPHSAHMTILARSGVPGLVLWIVTCVTWTGMMLAGLIMARLEREPAWAKLFLWLLCYEVAIIVTASFDVALEGPMIGIWFWSLFGLGIAAKLIYASPYRPVALATDGISRCAIRQ